MELGGFRAASAGGGGLWEGEGEYGAVDDGTLADAFASSDQNLQNS